MPPYEVCADGWGTLASILPSSREEVPLEHSTYPTPEPENPATNTAIGTDPSKEPNQNQQYKESRNPLSPRGYIRQEEFALITILTFEGYVITEISADSTNSIYPRSSSYWPSSSHSPTSRPSLTSSEPEI